MKQLKPLKMLPNRVWRSYLGGALLDELRGDEQKDCYFPEDWLASVVMANNPKRDDTPEREGLSRVETEDGIAYLKDLMDADPVGFLGEEHIKDFGENFGILTKFLDSAERLPIQVHPDKKAARALFNSDYGKTESWYILNGRKINGEDPYILLGFKEDVTKEMLKELFDKQDIKGMEALMHKIPVKTGDIFIIDGGTPHAIGSGCFLLEVQEPTDYTISLEKTNSLGEKLPDFLCHMGLGFDKMFDCFNYIKYSEEDMLKTFKLQPKTVEKTDDATVTELISYDRTKCFSLRQTEVNGAYNRKQTCKPSAFVITEGNGSVAGISVKCGDCLFVPAMTDDFIIEGELTVLECLPPIK